MEQNDKKPVESGKEPNEQADSNQGGEARAASAGGSPAPARELEQEVDKNPYQGEQLFWARFSAIAQAAFSCLLFIVAVAQWRVYNEQKGIMQTQTGIAKTQAGIALLEARPWMKLDSMSVLGVQIDADTVRISFKYSVRNVGHSAVTRVRVLFNPIPQIEGLLDHWDDGKVICDKAKSDKVNRNFIDTGSAVFPDGTYGADNVEIALSVSDIVRQQGRVTPQGIYPPEVRERMLQGGEIWITGCIAYEFEGSTEVHGTSFIWELSGPGHTAIDVSKPAQIDPRFLNLTDTHMGVFID